MQDCWLTAFIAPTEALGKTLRGLSPFHCLVLEGAHSPYFLGGQVETADMLLAVHVCSHGWAERNRVLSDMDSVRAWGAERGRDVNWSALAATLQSYFAAWMEMPRFWTRPDSGGTLRANWCWHLATFGMRELGMTEAEAWDCPVARLAAYRACANEADGGKDLLTDDEVRGIESLKASA